MKAINERFEDKEFNQLLKIKKELAKKKGKDNLSWHDFILILAEI